jgi:transcriptional regulator with XRE-family HTH domain
VDDHRIGQAIRAMRMRRGWRQVDLAIRARTSQNLISRIERGRAGGVTLDGLRRVAAALDARLDVIPRWHGADL